MHGQTCLCTGGANAVRWVRRFLWHGFLTRAECSRISGVRQPYKAGIDTALSTTNTHSVVMGFRPRVKDPCHENGHIQFDVPVGGLRFGR